MEAERTSRAIEMCPVWKEAIENSAILWQNIGMAAAK
jgi:hypothetical protein